MWSNCISKVATCLDVACYQSFDPESELRAQELRRSFYDTRWDRNGLKGSRRPSRTTLYNPHSSTVIRNEQAALSRNNTLGGTKYHCGRRAQDSTRHPQKISERGRRFHHLAPGAVGGADARVRDRNKSRYNARGGYSLLALGPRHSFDHSYKRGLERQRTFPMQARSIQDITATRRMHRDGNPIARESPVSTCFATRIPCGLIE